MSKPQTTKSKGRVLTPSELELADALQKALVGKATAETAVIVSRREIGRLTQEINKLSFDENGKRKPGLLRATVIWAEAREKLGASPSPTREELTKGT